MFAGFGFDRFPQLRGELFQERLAGRFILLEAARARLQAHFTELLPTSRSGWNQNTRKPGMKKDRKAAAPLILELFIQGPISPPSRGLAHPDHLTQEVFPAGLQPHDLLTRVGGLDAEETVVGFIGQVGEALRFFDPGIPHDGGAAA
jgi:hypothetical protein